MTRIMGLFTNECIPIRSQVMELSQGDKGAEYSCAPGKVYEQMMPGIFALN